MAKPPKILVLGGSGVFGKLLAQELLRSTNSRLLIAGRNPRRIDEAYSSLNTPDRCEKVTLDLANLTSFERVLSGCFAVICAAGPFQDLSTQIPAIAVRAGAHWLDISDDRNWILGILRDKGLDQSANQGGLTVAPGLSSNPALTGVLARWCKEQNPAAASIRSTLFIGNRNPKGMGAIASYLDTEVYDPIQVQLPVGRKWAYRFKSADEDLNRQALGIESEFRVAFEYRAAHWVMSSVKPVAGKLGRRGKAIVAESLSALALPFNSLGTDVGCIYTEVVAPPSLGVHAALKGQGQRMAILACALAAEALLKGESVGQGCIQPAAWQPTKSWINQLTSRGVEFLQGSSDG